MKSRSEWCDRPPGFHKETAGSPNAHFGWSMASPREDPRERIKERKMERERERRVQKTKKRERKRKKKRQKQEKRRKKKKRLQRCKTRDGSKNCFFFLKKRNVMRNRPGSPGVKLGCAPLSSRQRRMNCFSFSFHLVTDAPLLVSFSIRSHVDCVINHSKTKPSGISRCGSQPSTSRKAYDAVEHSSVCMALREQGVDEPYIQLLTKLYDQQRAPVHTDVKSKHFHFDQGTKQGDPLSTLSFNSLLQYTWKPSTGKWKRCNYGVRLAEHDPSTNFANLRFADDILRISGSLKHTTTMLDNFTTATMAHGPQLHSTKTEIISNTTSQRGRNNTMAVHGMNIEILPPQGQIKYVGHFSTSKNTRRSSRV